MDNNLVQEESTKILKSVLIIQNKFYIIKKSKSKMDYENCYTFISSFHKIYLKKMNYLFRSEVRGPTFIMNLYWFIKIHIRVSAEIEINWRNDNKLIIIIKDDKR
jgi:hypothetical protein